MSQTSRRRRPLDRSSHPVRDSRLAIIATEGEATEPQYFRAFERRDSTIQVEVLETTDGKSAPKHVLRRLREYKRKYELGQGDLLFLVIDTDRWPPKQMAEVASEARRQKFVLTVSCPCFDVWLYLHHDDLPDDVQTMTSQQIKTSLRGLLGEYNPAKLKMEMFIPNVADAIRRAKTLDVKPGQRWPNQPGSRVYIIMECILAN